VDASHGFPPVARADARVLLLGTLPGVASLRQQRYYGHPANAFWRIMGEIAGASPTLPYEERLERLIACNIALWDVCASAEREGSLDSAIRGPVPNNFAAFFAAHQSVGLICFNGQPAHQLFRRLVAPGLDGQAAALPRHVLPSTSPAHARMTYETKLAHWRKALEPALEPSPAQSTVSKAPISMPKPERPT
jgi:hypoxanthine-DNA glycosylase